MALAGWVLVTLASPARGQSSPEADADAEPAIVDLRVEREGTAAVASFRVERAFGPELLERMSSGIEVVFRHRVEVVARRPVPLWPARVLARVDIETAARFDSLTRQYYLEKRGVLETHGDRVPEGVEPERSATPSFDEAVAWMTRFERLVLEGAIDPDAAERTVLVRVKSQLSRRYRFYLFPMAETAEAVLALPR
jgi:hypothetical protein